MDTKRVLEGPGGLRIEDDLTMLKHPPKEVRAARREQALKEAGDKGAEAAKALQTEAPADPAHGQKSGAANNLLFHQWKPDDDASE